MQALCGFLMQSAAKKWRSHGNAHCSRTRRVVRYRSCVAIPCSSFFDRKILDTQKPTNK